MTTISNVLFWVANSLLIPDIILLLALFVRSLLLVGSSYGQYMTKRKLDKQFKEKINTLTTDKLADLQATLPTKNNSLFIKYLRELFESSHSEANVDRLISNFEIESDKDLSISKTLTKLGPILGLVGTLIAMSPALVGLSTGDISAMAYNMQVVFATTVVGLVVSAIGFITLQMKQRWYLQDVTNLDFISKVIMEKHGKNETQK